MREMNESSAELHEKWLGRWRQFFDEHPNGKPKRMTKWAVYISQVKKGTAPAEMTEAYWRVAYERFKRDGGD